MPSLLLAFFVALTARATSIVEVPFPETVQDAPVIARGKIGKSRVDYATLPGGGRRIYTFYDFDVSEVLKGQMPMGAGTIREMGGEKDGMGLNIPGAAHFNAGEDVVALLSDRNPDGSYDVRGLMMGKINVVKDESGQETLFGPAIQGSGAEHAQHVHPGLPGGGQGGPGKKVTWTIDSLRKLILEQEAKIPAGQRAQSPTISTPSPGPGGGAAPPLRSAPGLQPHPPGGLDETEREEPSTRWGLILVGIAGLLGLAVWLFRRRRL